MDATESCVPIDFRAVCTAVKEKRKAQGVIPPEILSAIASSKRLALGELAGKDSVAAMVKAYDDGVFDAVIPVVIRTGTEYGSTNFIDRNVSVVRRKTGGVVSKPVVMQDFEFWHALNGRFVSELSRRFGFYSPCLGCHLYLHAMRVPLALLVGARSIVSGERETHDGKQKINQLPFSLDFHEQLTSKWNIQLNLSLRHVSSELEVDRILGGACSSKDQFCCVFSGNYRTPDGRIGVPVEAVRRFYAEYGFPVAQKAVEALLTNPQINLLKLVGESFK